MADAEQFDAEAFYGVGCSDATGAAVADDAAFSGKPIHLLSGAETMVRTDLSIGALYPITITRRYNSRSGYDSPLGYGWALNYDRRIYTYPDGSVVLRKECGWKRKFTFFGGGYSSPIGESGTLILNADGTYTYTAKDGSREQYDVRGRLSKKEGPEGNAVVLFYESDEPSELWGILNFNLDQSHPLIVSYDYRVSRIEERNSSGSATGTFVDLHYDSWTGQLSDIVDSSGRTVSYGYDPIGNLKDVTGPAASAIYGYTDSDWKHGVSSINEGQGEYVNDYDATGRVKTQTHAGGTMVFDYIEPYLKTKVTTTPSVGAAWTKTVEFYSQNTSSRGMVAKETDTYGNVTEYTRSGIWVTDERRYENTGTVSTPVLVLRRNDHFEYDNVGNMLSRTETGYGVDGATVQSQKTTTWTYQPVFNTVLTETVQSVVNPAENRVTTNAYNAATGNLETVTETGLLGNGSPYSYTTTYTYYPNGKVWTVDGPRTDVSDITTYTYTSQGYIQSVNQPLIGTTTYANHDGLGNPRTVTDPNGNSTTYTYDDIGRVLTLKAAGDVASTQYFYVSAGCSSCGGGANKIDYIILPEGNMIDYTYDVYGNLEKISDSAGNSINYTHDSEGNRLTEQIKDSAQVLQKSLSYQYDALNRLQRVTKPDSSYSEYAYNFRGSRASAKDPNGNTTTYEYDALNRLLAVHQPGTVDTLYGYNANNNLTSVQDDNGATTQYKYDDMGRVYQVISPDTGTTTYTYDPAGNLTGKTDAKGVTISYSYDALNRLTTINFPADVDIVYSYDNCLNGKGRLCSMTDASGSTTYEYTPKGQVKKETKTIDSVQYITQYTYDQNGNMKTMTYPSGKVITYNYTNDRAVSVLNGAAELVHINTYKPFGGISTLTYGNGRASTVSYDKQYRVTGVHVAGAMNLFYSPYDNSGNILAIQDLLDPTKNRSFTYDTLDRLDTATGFWGSLDWGYDGVGNRLIENTTTYTYQPGTNRLNTVGGVTFQFDSNGNTTAEGSRQFVYDQNQRLIRVTDAGVTKGEYTYNGNGQRVRKDAAGVATIFHYSLNGQIIAESNGTGTITAEYVYLNGQPLAKLEGANTYYYHNDHLGTPQKMTDASGTVVWAADYKPFGEATITVSTITNNLRFPGQYFDAETGTLYNYFRDYNPIIGRYIEKDPIGIRGGLNLYRYVRNNPVRFRDKFGLADPATGTAITTLVQKVVELGAAAETITITTIAGVLVLITPSTTALDPQEEAQKNSTPYTGPPRSQHTNPDSGQERVYGPDGWPQTDIDYDHSHNGEKPHAHNWDRDQDGNPDRGDGVPVSPWPQGRQPQKKCP